MKTVPRARPILLIFQNRAPKNVPDRQKCVAFRKSQKVPNHSTLRSSLLSFPLVLNQLAPGGWLLSLSMGGAGWRTQAQPPPLFQHTVRKFIEMHNFISLRLLNKRSICCQIYKLEVCYCLFFSFVQCLQQLGAAGNSWEQLGTTLKLHKHSVTRFKANSFKGTVENWQDHSRPTFELVATAPTSCSEWQFVCLP